MNVTINGKEMHIPEDVDTVAKLISHLEIRNPVVIVELNDEILQKEDHEKTTIKADDRIEFIQFVGGG
ncbi:MAG TPA: sulfur carrier protein ThiS [Pseudogracilibacillus sp.]|nr:sulfur carrier protein ThiS [Pseudogracilibacillus sp.]